MDELERRIIHLEHIQSTDRQILQLHLASFHQRLSALEAREPTSPVTNSGSIKLWLAFLLPLLVLLMTGDLKAALRALRLAATGG
jgi:hypothetical protein